MKPELLEFLIRECAREVLTQINEGDQDIKGAAAPPADGQGTADQPAIPNEEPKIPEKPQQPETPPAPALKGMVFVNPKDKSKLQKVDIKSGDDATIERSLHALASRSAGAKVKISLSAMRAVKNAISNPNAALYLYVGQYDPQSEELFLMADNSLQVAKDASVAPEEMSTMSAPVSTTAFNAMAASPGEFANHLANQGYTQPTAVTEELRKAIKAMVEKIMDAQ